MTRTCSRCRETRLREEFYVLRNGRLSSHCRPCGRAMTLAWRAKNPRKRRAHVLVANRVKWEPEFRPDACERCGKRTRLVAHHEDYRKPLVVMWLCDPCHGRRHVELRTAARANGKLGGAPKKKES